MAKQKTYQYSDFNEVLIPREAAQLMRISQPGFMAWLHSGKTPFGEIIEGVHYYKAGPEYRIIKDKLCKLVGILPKDNGFVPTEFKSLF